MSIVEYSAQVHKRENMKPCSIDSFDAFIVKFIIHIYIYTCIRNLLFFFLNFQINISLKENKWIDSF